MDCLFCNIAQGSIPAKVVYHDDNIIAFEDINPQAPTHIVIIPHKHIATLNDISEEDTELLGYMVETGAKLAKKFDLSEDGYRLVYNCNEGAGQSVFHIHAHLLGGRRMKWPPG